MDFDSINAYISDNKAELVYNYIQEGNVTDYDDLLEIKGIGIETVNKLKKYTYIKGVD